MLREKKVLMEKATNLREGRKKVLDRSILNVLGRDVSKERKLGSLLKLFSEKNEQIYCAFLVGSDGISEDAVMKFYDNTELVNSVITGDSDINEILKL